MESMKGQTKEPESSNNGGGGTVEPRKKTLPEMKSWNRFAALIVVKEIRDYLDLCNQAGTGKACCPLICDHYNHVRRCLDDQESDQAEYVKPNVLLLGPLELEKLS